MIACTDNATQMEIELIFREKKGILVEKNSLMIIMGKESRIP